MGWIIRILRKKKKKDGEFGDWYWRIEHINGEILATSETYSSIAKAQQTVESLKRGLMTEFWQKIVEAGD